MKKKSKPSTMTSSLPPSFMELTLSWDLFVIVFFGVVISYSFIIGKHEAVKVIVFTYIAIVAGQAGGNILQRFTNDSQPLLNKFGLTIDITMLESTKLLVFVGIIILLAIRGGFEVEYNNEANTFTNSLLTGIFGFATAGLLLSTLLTFVTGGPLLDLNLATTASYSPIIQQSRLMQIMIFHQDLWFALPALLLIGVGIVSNK